MRQPPDRLTPLTISATPREPSPNVPSLELWRPCWRAPSCFAGVAAPAAVRAESGRPCRTLGTRSRRQSDDPAEVMQRAAAEDEDRRGARGGRGFGPPGARGGMGRGGMGRGGGRGAPGGGGAPLLSLPDLLEIEADAAELRLVLEERVQILYLDGEEHAREDGRGGRITSVAEFPRRHRARPGGTRAALREARAVPDAPGDGRRAGRAHGTQGATERGSAAAPERVPAARLNGPASAADRPPGRREKRRAERRVQKQEGQVGGQAVSEEGGFSAW